jgi:hypothetical protein
MFRPCRPDATGKQARHCAGLSSHRHALTLYPAIGGPKGLPPVKLPQISVFAIFSLQF